MLTFSDYGGIALAILINVTPRATIEVTATNLPIHFVYLSCSHL
ncbi:hypothetical protein [Bartonella sp. DGB1]